MDWVTEMVPVYLLDVDDLVVCFAKEEVANPKNDGLSLVRSLWEKRGCDAIHWTCPVGVARPTYAALVIHGICRLLLDKRWTERRRRSLRGRFGRYQPGLVLFLYMVYQTQWSRGCSDEAIIRVSPSLWACLEDLASLGDATSGICRDVRSVVTFLFYSGAMVAVGSLDVAYPAPESFRPKVRSSLAKQMESMMVTSKHQQKTQTGPPSMVQLNTSDEALLENADRLTSQTCASVLPLRELGDAIRAYRVKRSTEIAHSSSAASSAALDALQAVDGSLEVDLGRLLMRRQGRVPSSWR